MELNTMSNVAFHSPARTVRIHGPERWNARALCADLLIASLRLYSEHEEENKPNNPLRRLVSNMYDKSLRIRSGAFFQKDFEHHLRRTDRRAGLIDPGGRGSINCWSAALNTALAAGGDVVCFLARMDAQCELHGYIEGQHRAWLAEIIEEGLFCKILRPVYDGSRYKDSPGKDWGWAQLVGMLHESATEPVVMGHSVTGESFPNRWSASSGNEALLSDAEWNALPDDDRWQRSMNYLRSLTKERWLELAPDTLTAAYFGQGWTGYELRAALDEEIEQEHEYYQKRGAVSR